jgi:elongation factor 2 kinase
MGPPAPTDDDHDDSMLVLPCGLADFEDIDVHQNAEGDGDDEGSSSDDEPTGRYAKQGKKKEKADKKTNEKPEFKPALTLRQRRRQNLGYEDVGLKIRKLSDCDPVGKKRTVSETETPSPCITPSKQKWMHAMKKLRNLRDPWEKFHLDELKVETCTRHRYNALKKKWVTDKVQVKMETEPFNHGAMRECYRLKKLSNFSAHKDWKHAHNYVAKRYMEDVDRDVYFEDVRLQMDAKLWGEEYNNHNPPKKVDIFQMNIIEFENREGKPLFHLEHYIDGDYIKYNSNSGFVDEKLRLTPQAFSHFTFERSGHQLIIVDIQGVGDLWTDPQIHTADGKGYGDGNLGTKGMALFFHSHVCNSVCERFQLSKFDLSSNEEENQSKFILMQRYAETRTRGTEEAVISASPTEVTDISNFLSRSRRSRTVSGVSNNSSIMEDISELSEADLLSSHSLPEDNGFGAVPMSPDTPDRVAPTDFFNRRGVHPGGRRSRFMSESDDSAASTLTEEDERRQFEEMAKASHRPADVNNEFNRRNDAAAASVDTALGDSILGQIHHEMAKYYELGRFSETDNEIDWEAAVFHETQAAHLGVMEAIVTLAKLYLGMQPDVLVNCIVEQTDENREDGLKYMERAAQLGDRSSLIFMAEALETGNNLPKSRTRSYKLAVDYYQKACETEADKAGEYDATMDTPMYQLKAKMAALYLEGGHGLTKDPSYAGDLYVEAADAAQNATKGRLASQYYEKSEEAYSQVPDE